MARFLKIAQEDAKVILDILTSETFHLDAKRRGIADVERGSIEWLIAVFLVWSILAYGSRKQFATSLLRPGRRDPRLLARRLIIALRPRTQR